MRYVLTSVLMISTVTMLAVASLGNDSASHSVTINVFHISRVAVVGGDISLQLGAPATGREGGAVTNNTCGLLWTTNLTDTKITVEANSAGIHTSLHVEAVNVVGGEATGIALLSANPVVLVDGISHSTGGCGLRYTATAPPGDWEGSETFTITYTILTSD